MTEMIKGVRVPSLCVLYSSRGDQKIDASSNFGH